MEDSLGPGESAVFDYVDFALESGSRFKTENTVLKSFNIRAVVDGERIIAIYNNPKYLKDGI